MPGQVRLSDLPDQLMKEFRAPTDARRPIQQNDNQAANRTLIELENRFGPEPFVYAIEPLVSTEFLMQSPCPSEYGHIVNAGGAQPI